jgi:glycosyltransferase involved in cell wall biosynthesis
MARMLETAKHAGLESHGDPGGSPKRLLKNTVTVAYSGTHQAYQIARAANEAGMLDTFFCSLCDAPGKWGRKLSFVLGKERLTSRRGDGLDPHKVIEIPAPWLRHELSSRFFRSQAEWLAANSQFDRRVAERLKKSKARVFVGVETCAQFCFEVARERGLRTVLDVPGIPAHGLDAAAAQAAKGLGLAIPARSDSPAMRERKVRELALADMILVCSEFQRRLLIADGVPAEKINVVPLWVDTDLWFPPETRKVTAGALRVIFVGKVSLRKGVPFLLEAIRRCSFPVELSLVGPIASEMEGWLRGCPDNVKVFGPKTKQEIRALHWQHDVFILPSLGDSFGFAALEAMACGLPVIVSENCGIPVPKDKWRVPVASSEEIGAQLSFYRHAPELLREEGVRAAAFARQFTPRSYRKRIFSVLTMAEQRTEPVI